MLNYHLPTIQDPLI